MLLFVALVISEVFLFSVWLPTLKSLCNWWVLLMAICLTYCNNGISSLGTVKSFKIRM